MGVYFNQMKSFYEMLFFIKNLFPFIELAERYLEFVQDINHSIHMIELNMLARDAKGLYKMFNVFKEMAETYGLLRNDAFSKAFGEYKFEEMTKYVDEIGVADGILSEYM